MIHIAGGIVWNPTLGIVVVSQRNNSWSLPKGHVEVGEDNLTAAIREIEEETGISANNLELIREVGTYERNRTTLHPDDDPELRNITLFFFKTTTSFLAPNDKDNPEAKFVPIYQVSRILTHEKDKIYFERFARSAPEFSTDNNTL